jgi:hypothetical protein
MIVTLKDVLRRQWVQTQVLDKSAYAGGPQEKPKEKDKPLSALQAKQLRDGLNKAISRNKPILLIIFALIVLLLLATVAAAFAAVGSVKGMDWASLTSGGILAVLIPAAMKLWREITKLEMMVVFATMVQGEALTALMRLLLEGAQQPAAAGGGAAPAPGGPAAHHQ